MPHHRLPRPARRRRSTSARSRSGDRPVFAVAHLSVTAPCLVRMVRDDVAR